MVPTWHDLFSYGREEFHIHDKGRDSSLQSTKLRVQTQQDQHCEEEDSPNVGGIHLAHSFRDGNKSKTRSTWYLVIHGLKISGFEIKIGNWSGIILMKINICKYFNSATFTSAPCPHYTFYNILYNCDKCTSSKLTSVNVHSWVIT